MITFVLAMIMAIMTGSADIDTGSFAPYADDVRQTVVAVTWDCGDETCYLSINPDLTITSGP